MSVMMPAYNTGRYVAEAIESIQAQTYRNWELIFVDDGSDDYTPDIVKRYAVADKRIKYHRIDHGGRGVARIKCIELAAGEYIAVCDSDDVSLPERFGRQVRFLEDHPEIGVVSSQVRYFSDELPLQDLYQYPEKTEDIRRRFNKGKMGVGHCASMFRKSLIDQVGSYCAQFLRAQDLDLFLRFNEITNFVTLSEILVHYRNNPRNTSYKFWLLLYQYSRYAKYRRNAFRRRSDPEDFFRWKTRPTDLALLYIIDTIRFVKYFVKYRYIKVSVH